MVTALKQQVLVSLPAAVVAILLVAGCQRAEPPSTVANDVAAAEQKAASQTERARADAARDVANAQQKVDQKAVERNNVAAEDSYKVAMARADGAHDVALQQCKGLSGDAQRHCKNQADADYEAAKANAKALEVSRKQ
jgi:hypothetical protein